MTSWLRCKRQWWLQYYRQLRIPEAERENRAATVGVLVHSALEQLYSPQPIKDPDSVIPSLVENWVQESPQYEAETRSAGELATTMFHAYLKWLEDSRADQYLEIYDSESQTKVPLGKTGWTLTGRMDAKARRLGQKIIIDHKTVKSLDEIPKTAQINHQFLTYHLVEYLNDKDDPIDCVMINMFRRVDSNNEKAKPPFFDRFEIRYNKEELRNHWYHVLSVANDIARAIERLDSGKESHHVVVPPSPDKSCAWSCDYRHLCPMFDDGSNVEGFIAMHYTEGGVFD